MKRLIGEPLPLVDEEQKRCDEERVGGEPELHGKLVIILDEQRGNDEIAGENPAQELDSSVTRCKTYA